jgi:1,4-alpha-glucan branching enzyme
MGWMNDTLHYMQTDFPWRPGNHGLLTFSIMYSFNENFILPLSHDEVVHGKCSLITRQPGDYWRQFAGMRSLAFYQMTHPGGKLNFMGNEIAQFIEWRYYEGIQYFLAEQYEAHGKQQHFVAALNKFYNEHPALWELAYSDEGFEWINANDADQSIISYVRHGDDPKDDLVVLINFDPATYERFKVGLPKAGLWREVFNTDATEFGGSGVTNTGVLYESLKDECDGREDSVIIRVPPIGGVVLAWEGPLPTRKPARRSPAKKAAVKKAATTKATTTKAKPARTSAAAKKESAAAKKESAAAKKESAAAKPAEAAKPAATKKPATRSTRAKKAQSSASEAPEATEATEATAPKRTRSASKAK